MHDIRFSPRGERDWKKLNPHIRQRIQNKLVDYAAMDDPLQFAKPLVNLPPASHRFRIGKYRVSFFVSHRTLFIERVELRSEAYRA